MTLLPNLIFHRIHRGFRKTFSTNVACRQGTLFPLDTSSHPICALYISYLFGHIFSQTCVSLLLKTLPFHPFCSVCCQFLILFIVLEYMHEDAAIYTYGLLLTRESHIFHNRQSHALPTNGDIGNGTKKCYLWILALVLGQNSFISMDTMKL